MPGPQYWHLTLKQIGEPKSVPRHILIILSSNGTFNQSGDRRKDRFWAAELHRAHCLVSLAWHSGGSRKRRACPGAKKKRTPHVKRLRSVRSGEGRVGTPNVQSSA